MKHVGGSGNLKIMVHGADLRLDECRGMSVEQE